MAVEVAGEISATSICSTEALPASVFNATSRDSTGQGATA